MQLYHDIPKSQGVANAIKRARQMVELEWTPRGMFPCNYVIPMPGDIPAQRIGGYFAPWKSQKGMVYSSVRTYERFVGFNISLETFMTAVANPYSVLYTRPQHGKGRSMSSFYGNVCSCMVSYAMELPYMVPCAQWPALKGISEISTEDLDALELGDIVLHTSRHIAVITDILRDADGHVHQICVSESTPPLCITRPYTQEAFRGYWMGRDFKVYRYAGIHNVTYTPSPYVHLEGDPDLEPEINTALMPDFGNKANYLKDIEPAEISVLEDGWENVAVTYPDGRREIHTIEDGKVVIPNEVSGYYTACCVRGEEQSRCVEWCVVNTTVTTDKEVYSPGETIRVRFCVDAAEDAVCTYIVKNSGDLNRGREIMPAEAAETGEFLLVPDLRMHQPDNYSILIVAQNKYGQYASTRAYFRVEE